MSKLTQGTQVYFIDPDSCEVVTIQCATAFNPGGAPADQIDDTCLEDLVRAFKRGLRTPGQATLTINADPAIDSHVRLHELSESNEDIIIQFAVGWRDGTSPPAADSDCLFDLPQDRTFFVFQGYVSDFPFDFQLNAVVTTQVQIQRSGGSQWVRKAS